VLANANVSEATALYQGALLSRLDPNHEWGSEAEVTLYLDRCQVDTPDGLVKKVWSEVLRRRERVGKVVDFGAGDGRFSREGRYQQYMGVEIDGHRCAVSELPINAKLIHACAFSQIITDADLCIGNPPYVRNQDLPVGWRQKASKVLEERCGVVLSGLANAWQYFFLLSVLSAKADGIVALVIPYEWVSRPSARAVREFIRKNHWNVEVFRLLDDSFDRVLTTSSITIVDKSKRNRMWSYFEQGDDGAFVRLPAVTASSKFLQYSDHKKAAQATVKARRGLSPGTQRVLTLTEAERARLGLQVGRDVVPCVTTLRHLPSDVLRLDKAAFQRFYIRGERKCWLLNTVLAPSRRLQAYVDSVPAEERATATCEGRSEWWKFTMPAVPEALVSTGFRGLYTKSVANVVRARAVGGVAGVYGLRLRERDGFVERLVQKRLGDRVVSHSHGLRKVESNQLNSVIQSLTKAR